jgi:hypothetical protein
VSCKFYGASGHPEFEKLLGSGGNQCALIVESFSPCRMEIAGQEVDFSRCELNGSQRAIQFENFVRLEFANVPKR